MLNSEDHAKLREVVRKLEVHIEDRRGSLNIFADGGGSGEHRSLVEMGRMKVSETLAAWEGAKRYLLDAYPELAQPDRTESPSTVGGPPPCS